LVEINQNCSSLENVAAAALHKPLVVAGIPAYNEEKTIARVVLGAQKHAHIVVVCDDGSSGVDLEIRYEKSRAGDIKDSYADISKAKKFLGYEPKVSLRDGLRALVEEKTVAT
jgi:UDP-glucose 4-epimerase